MDYNIERKLADKIDRWEFHNLQTENRELKNHIIEIERKITNLENTNNNCRYVIERLCNLLVELPIFMDISNEVYQLRSNL